jgi:hypothetical protein
MDGHGLVREKGHQVNESEFQAARERLAAAVSSIPPCSIDVIHPQTGEPVPWFWFDRAEFLALQTTVDALANEDFTNDVRGVVAAQVIRWGRAEAAAKRVWSFHDRKLREWKAAQFTIARMKPAGADEKWKQPSSDAIEATYRQHHNYGPLNAAVERAEEAHSTARSVLSAWETLGAMLARDGT